MTEYDRWQKNNQAYLAAALEWLRLRLGRLVPKPRSRVARATGPVPTGKTAGTGSRDPRTRIAGAARKMAAAAEKDPPPALPLLGRLLGLLPFEQEILLLCAAMELDTRMASLCASVQDDPGRPFPTFSLALALFDDPAWEALSPQRPLRHWHLIEIITTGNQPLTASALRADERIVSYIKGLNFLDDRITPYLAPFHTTQADAGLSASQQMAVDRAVAYLRWSSATSACTILQLVGPDIFSKQLVARHAATAIGHHLYRLPADFLPDRTEELEKLSRLWHREGLLLPVALYIDAHFPGQRPGLVGQVSPLRHFLARGQGIFLLAARDVYSDLETATTVVEVDKPTPDEQQALWHEALGSDAGDSPGLLAAQFKLNAGAIRWFSNQTDGEKTAPEVSRHEHLWQVCLAGTRPGLDLLAQRLEPRAVWNDIVLPGESETLLRQIASQVRHRNQVYEQWGFRRKMNRGLGISALFTGESGTGKTMAAEVIANDLKLNLYRIDLSQVVSKYIGETEKNLGRLFDAAEDGGTILFFDEADALFGKRSEVKDSHDRYANIEINYLLQRLETYRGLAILATNMKSALDRAFLRRLRFIVVFPFPDANQRETIWANVFPPQTEIDPVVKQNWGFLARLNITGGSIHTIALNAAFMAAQTGGAVTMPLVLDAARQEFRKMERPVREADFTWKAVRQATA